MSASDVCSTVKAKFGSHIAELLEKTVDQNREYGFFICNGDEPSAGPLIEGGEEQIIMDPNCPRKSKHIVEVHTHTPKYPGFSIRDITSPYWETKTRSTCIAYSKDNNLECIDLGPVDKRTRAEWQGLMGLAAAVAFNVIAADEGRKRIREKFDTCRVRI